MISTPAHQSQVDETSVATPSTSNAITPSPQRSKQRRGKGSRAKAAEKFRKHKNETVGMNYINDRIAKFHLSVGYDPDELFGPLTTAVTLTKPALSVNVSTHALSDVARQTVETLVNACKVPTTDLEADVECVQVVSAMQLSAKLQFASVGTPFCDPSAEHEGFADRVEANLGQSILPIAVFIDQVGRVEVEGQTFVPVEDPVEDVLNSFSFRSFEHPNLRNRDSFSFLRSGWFTSDGTPCDTSGCTACLVNGQHALGPNGGNMFMRILDIEQARNVGFVDEHGNVLFQYVPAFAPGVVEFLELYQHYGLPSFDSIVRRYYNFISRVQKKVAFEKLPTLALRRGIGTSAQLVANGDWVQGVREVWSSRPVTRSDFFLSAAFELGINRQPLHNIFVAVESGVVDSRNAIPRLMQCLTQRVERK